RLDPAELRTRAEGGSDPAAELRHLVRERARPRLTATRDDAFRDGRRRRAAAPPSAATRREACAPVRLAAGRAVPVAAALVRKVVAAAEEATRQPLPRLRAGERVEEDAEHDPDEQEAAVPALVHLFALDAVCRAAQLCDRRAQLVLDVPVGGDTRG